MTTLTKENKMEYTAENMLVYAIRNADRAQDFLYSDNLEEALAQSEIALEWLKDVVQIIKNQIKEAHHD